MSFLSWFRRGKDRPFRPGERYRYLTRPCELDSRIVILRVDPHERLGPIIHLAIENVEMTPPGAPKPLTRIGHIPISLAALRASQPRLDAKRVELPDYQEGYDLWRTEFDAGRAGVFTLPVAEIVEAMAVTIAKGSKGAG
jgi:hypothetical protein